MSTFITFEGIEGCGKTTQMKLLSRHLAEKGFPAVMTREPGGCPISLKIRDILLDAANSRMVPLAELLLYAAARAQHVAEVIKPALDAGKIVLCDRFTDATVAYQGYGRQLDQSLIGELNRLAAGNVRPGLTVLIDCEVETGLKRANDRIEASTGAREERFELESVQFHRRVREGYLRLAAAEPDRFIVIDGDRSVGEVEESISAAVLARLDKG
ncbi:MAG TPA: dTMP kinase [Geobacteraceae bacterium]|nr:dTMP kinase [Geobacteraceae bacterium]